MNREIDIEQYSRLIPVQVRGAEIDERCLDILKHRIIVSINNYSKYVNSFPFVPFVH